MYNKIVHAVMAVILFAIPVVLSSHSGVLDLTVGGILNAMYLYVSQIAYPTAPVK
jgi:hypothetical protein